MRVHAGRSAAPRQDYRQPDRGYLTRHWTKIKAALLDGSYNPLPVRRKQIDKPDGGVRLHGIPTVLDRIIQLAIAQVVEQIWDPTFSDAKA